MKFDNVLKEVNGFGRFQVRTMLLMVPARMALPFHFLLNNFIAALPSHYCNIDYPDDGGVFRNVSLAQRLLVHIPRQKDGRPNSCRMFAEPQYHLLFLNSSDVTDTIPTVPCKNGWTYDNSPFSSTLASEWDLVCDKSKMNQTTVTIFFIGVTIGAAVFGYLSDRFGRKRAILLAYLMTATFGFASALSNDFFVFASMRFLTGVGLSGISIISYVICIEWVDIKHRTATGVLMSLDWTIFTAVLPIVAYFVTDWRYLTVTVTCPLLLGLICWLWLPESARWLISNNKIQSAHFYLSKCAKFNGREEAMAALKPEVLSKVIIVEKENQKYSYIDLVKTPRMRRVALLTGIVWFGVASTYYGISLNVVGFGVNIYLTQFIFGAIEIPAKALVFFCVDRVGRRLILAGMLFLTSLMVFCIMFIPKDYGTFRTALGASGKLFSEGAFTTVYLYSSELYPTVLRQNGLGFCSFVARIGVSLCPLVLLLEEVWLNLPNVVFLTFAFSGGLSACFLPETKNTRLPETVEDVEQRRVRSSPTLDEKSPL